MCANAGRQAIQQFPNPDCSLCVDRCKKRGPLVLLGDDRDKRRQKTERRNKANGHATRILVVLFMRNNNGDSGNGYLSIDPITQWLSVCKSVFPDYGPSLGPTYNVFDPENGRILIERALERLFSSWVGKGRVVIGHNDDDLDPKYRLIGNMQFLINRRMTTASEILDIEADVIEKVIIQHTPYRLEDKTWWLELAQHLAHEVLIKRTPKLAKAMGIKTTIKRSRKRSR